MAPAEVRAELKKEAWQDRFAEHYYDRRCPQTRDWLRREVYPYFAEIRGMRGD